MDRFLTLMRREWMQHRNGWLVLMVLPAVLMLLLSLLDGRGMQVHIKGEDSTMPPLHQLPVVLQTIGWSLATVMLSLVLVVLVVLAQLPGLARRDVQDRSIEFWLSLPTSHAQSIGATLLMHLLVLPGLALTAAVLGGQLVAMLAIVGRQGVGSWLIQPWWQLLPVLLIVTARIWLGLLLAVAWLAPLLLLTMAASSWLKRWAIPVVAASLLLGVQGLDPQLATPIVQPALERVLAEAASALFATRALVGQPVQGLDDLTAMLPALPGLLWRDALQLLGRTISPVFGLGLLLGVLGFGLLVLRRQRQG